MVLTSRNKCSIMKKEGECSVKGRQSACAFTGHRPGKLPWKNDESDLRCVALKAKLYAAVESAIQEAAGNQLGQSGMLIAQSEINIFLNKS